MNPPRISPPVLALLYVAGVVAWWWLGPSVDAGTGSALAGDRSWNLDAHRQVDFDVERAAVEATRLWDSPKAGLPAQQDSEPLTPPDWRISGVYRSAKDAAVLISVPGKPDRQLGVGDSLPGGARIVAIAADHVCILLNGKRLSLNLYRE